MRKVNILVSLFLGVVIILTSCSPKQDAAFVEKAAAPPSGGNMLEVKSLDDKDSFRSIPNIDTNYIKLDDVNPGMVPEVRLDFKVDTYGSVIRETGDGFLCGDKAGPLTATSVSKAEKANPRIRRLDRSGAVLWEKEYEYKTYSGRINNIAVCSDGSFVFSVESFPYFNDGGPIYEKSLLLKCDRDGNEIWRKYFDDYTGEFFHNLFITKSNDIIAVGQWRTKDGVQVIDAAKDDIVITKIDTDGNIIKQKGFGGGDFEMLNISKYDESLGILINGRSQSNDGDFAIKDGRSSDFIACVDDSLNLKWVNLAGEDYSFIYDQLAVSEGSIYVLGSHNKGGGALVEGFLLKLDSNGKKAWQKSILYSGLWGRALSILKNGDIAISAGQQNQGIIIVLDQSGMEKKRMEDLKFSPSGITPTEDGGFIVTSNREIKTVPQPPYISSIWYDTELLAIKFKTDYTVEWRKAYDKYKDDRGSDFVLPLADGRMIVE